jgi:hypothetical protein
VAQQLGHLVREDIAGSKGVMHRAMRPEFNLRPEPTELRETKKRHRFSMRFVLSTNVFVLSLSW